MSAGAAEKLSLWKTAGRTRFRRAWRSKLAIRPGVSSWDFGVHRSERRSRRRQEEERSHDTGSASLPRRLHPAEAPVPTGVFLQRVNELLFAKIRPKRRCHNEFGVGTLPEQKVADPHFAAGANHQVGVGVMARVKMFANDVLVDLGRLDPSQLCFAGNVAH